MRPFKFTKSSQADKKRKSNEGNTNKAVLWSCEQLWLHVIRSFRKTNEKDI